MKNSLGQCPQGVVLQAQSFEGPQTGKSPSGSTLSEFSNSTSSRSLSNPLKTFWRNPVREFFCNHRNSSKFSPLKIPSGNSVSEFSFNRNHSREFRPLKSFCLSLVISDAERFSRFTLDSWALVTCPQVDMPVTSNSASRT